MNAYAIKAYFEAFPDIKECFETSDGILHRSKEEAGEWNKTHDWNKVVTHANPAIVKPETIKHLITEEDLLNNPDLEEQGVKVGDEVELPQ